jgi:hypothetical protein
MEKIEKNFTRDWLSKVRCLPDTLKADMQRDPTVPRLFRNIGHLRDYLVSQGASVEILAAVPRIWQSYSSWLGRNPGGLFRQSQPWI